MFGFLALHQEVPNTFSCVFSFFFFVLLPWFWLLLLLLLLLLLFIVIFDPVAAETEHLQPQCSVSSTDLSHWKAYELKLPTAFCCPGILFSFHLAFGDKRTNMVVLMSLPNGLTHLESPRGLSIGIPPEVQVLSLSPATCLRSWLRCHRIRQALYTLSELLAALTCHGCCATLCARCEDM